MPPHAYIYTATAAATATGHYGQTGSSASSSCLVCHQRYVYTSYASFSCAHRLLWGPSESPCTYTVREILPLIAVEVLAAAAATSSNSSLNALVPTQISVSHLYYLMTHFKILVILRATDIHLRVCLVKIWSTCRHMVPPTILPLYIN